MTGATALLLDGLRHVVGPHHVLTHDDPATDLGAWENDWRKRSQGRALAIVRPANTLEVAAVVHLCAAQQAATGVSIVPQGGISSGTTHRPQPALRQ